MLLIDMLLVFPFLFSKNLQTLFFLDGGVIVKRMQMRTCASVKRQMWVGGGEYARGDGHTASTAEDPTSRARGQRIFVSVALLGARNEETKECGPSRLVPVQPRTREV